VLRIEALLALARRDEALSILDGIGLASLPNPDEQLVVRGELRAGKARWVGARRAQPAGRERQGPEHPRTRAVGAGCRYRHGLERRRSIGPRLRLSGMSGAIQIGGAGDCTTASAMVTAASTPRSCVL